MKPQECFGGCFDGKTQSQAIFGNEFDLAGRHCRSRIDLNRQERQRCRRLLMFVEPVLDGLRRTTKFASDLGDGTMMDNNLFNGIALNGKVIARYLFRHQRSKKNILRKNHSTFIDTKDGLLNTPFVEGLRCSTCAVKVRMMQRFFRRVAWGKRALTRFLMRRRCVIIVRMVDWQSTIMFRRERCVNS